MHRELFKSGPAHLCHRHSSARGGVMMMVMKMMKMKIKMMVMVMKMKIKMKIKIMAMMVLRGRRFKMTVSAKYLTCVKL